MFRGIVQTSASQSPNVPVHGFRSVRSALAPVDAESSRPEGELLCTWSSPRLIRVQKFHCVKLCKSSSLFWWDRAVLREASRAAGAQRPGVNAFCFLQTVQSPSRGDERARHHAPPQGLLAIVGFRTDSTFSRHFVFSHLQASGWIPRPAVGGPATIGDVILAALRPVKKQRVV